MENRPGRVTNGETVGTTSERGEEGLGDGRFGIRFPRKDRIQGDDCSGQ